MDEILRDIGNDINDFKDYIDDVFKDFNKREKENKMKDIQTLQWLEKTMLASEFKDKLIELGQEDFIKYTEKQAKKSIKEYKENK